MPGPVQRIGLTELYRPPNGEDPTLEYATTRPDGLRRTDN